MSTDKGRDYRDYNDYTIVIGLKAHIRLKAVDTRGYKDGHYNSRPHIIMFY